MSQFSSTTFGLGNLLIGLGRAYQKEVRRLEKIATSPDMLALLIDDLNGKFLHQVQEHLGGYYSRIIKREVAYVLLTLIQNFDNGAGQRDRQRRQEEWKRRVGF